MPVFHNFHSNHIYIYNDNLRSAYGAHFYGFLNTDHPSSVLEQLKSCLSPEEQTQMSQMEDLMNMMEMMQTMNSDSDGENGFSPMDFMKGVFDNE